jgi:hypothetical protein
MTLLQPPFDPINPSRFTENKLTVLVTGDYRFWTYRTITQDDVRDDVVEARRTIPWGPEGTITLCYRPSGDYLTLPIDDLSDECKEWVKETDRTAAAQRSDAKTVQTPTQRPTLKAAAPKQSSASRQDATRISRREKQTGRRAFQYPTRRQKKVPKIHLKRKTRTMRFALWANGKKVERWVSVDSGWAPVIDLTGEDESEGAAVGEQADNLIHAVEIGE